MPKLAGKMNSNSTTSAEEALARAKAIAAKLSGGKAVTSAVCTKTMPASSSTISSVSNNKRSNSSRWGMTPTGTVSSKRVTAEKVTKRIWISTTEERPAAHFRAYLNRHIEQIVSQISKEDNANFTIELRGRGSAGKPPLPGMPLEPLHIWIEGVSSQLSQAEPLVESLLQQAEEAPIDEEAVRQENEAVKNTKYQLVSVGTNGGTSAYRPASVALLIGQANNPNTVANPDEPWIETAIQVPTGLVGYIIGKGGENVARLQAQTGARLQIQRETELAPGQTMRSISISAPTNKAAADCKRFIENIVSEKTCQINGGSSTQHHKDMQRVQEAIDAGHEHVIVKIPDEDVGLVIGKSGSTIKSLQERTGAAIQVLPSSDSDGYRTVNVTHPTTSGAMQAKAMIEDILKSKSQKSQEIMPQTTIEVEIPDSDVGLCIGRQGSVIRYMQQTTGTNIQIPPHCNPGEMHRVAKVSGTEENCKKVREMIKRIVTEQSSAGVMGGHPPAQQYYQQKSTDGHRAFSAEWAGYFAAQEAAAAQRQETSGYKPLVNQAHCQQQQEYHCQRQVPPSISSVVKQGNQARSQNSISTNAGGQLSSDAYYEQYFRYEYYYGTDAARSYYGAWSPPVGTPNPYGVNLNNTQPGAFLTAEKATAPASVAATVAPSTMDTRETSRRGVSNLPAWMTKK